MDTEKLTALSEAEPLNSFFDVQDIAIPLFNLNLVDNLHPRYPVHQENEDVGIITEDPDCLGAFCHCLQHVAAEGDICLIMGNDILVQHVDELDVVWKGIVA